MKKLLLISLICFYSCKTQVYLPVKKCIEKDNLSTIHKGVLLFESKLKDKYPNSTIEWAYFEFLQDLSTKNLSNQFFDDSISDSISKQIRNLKIWDISERTNENMEREAKLFNVEKMNPNNIKLEKNISYCLFDQTDSDGIKNFLLMNSKYRLSPKRIRNIFYSGTSESDLKKDTNRMIIALGVYYQTKFNINK